MTGLLTRRGRIRGTGVRYTNSMEGQRFRKAAAALMMAASTAGTVSSSAKMMSPLTMTLEGPT